MFKCLSSFCTVHISFFPFKVQAICAGLSDDSILVQRSVLDFILVFLPLHVNLISTSQKVSVMSATLGVLLRRDMSLNRRLYTWILGTNLKSSTSLSRADSVGSTDEQDSPMDTYFTLYSRPLVIEAVKSLFRQQGILGSGGKKAQRLEVLKPFRILISLLDKPEIGSPILEEVMLEVFRSLYVRCKILQENGAAFDELQRKDSLESVASGSVTDVVDGSNSSKTKLIDELVKTANLLFNAFEPFFLWEYMAKLLSECQTNTEDSCANTNGEVTPDNLENHRKGSSITCSEIFRLVDFILDVVALVSTIDYYCICIESLLKLCWFLPSSLPFFLPFFLNSFLPSFP